MRPRVTREWAVTAALGVVLLTLVVFAPNFFRPQPLLSLLAREAPGLVVACGMAFVIIARQIDISVGSQFGLCSVACGLLAAQGMPATLSSASSIACGMSLGALNGLLIAGLGLPSIVVTLAFLVAWRELLRWLQQGQFINLPEDFQWFGLSQTLGQWLILGCAVLILAALALAAKHLAAGRFVYAVGGDAEAARLAGISPRWVTFWVFVLMGGLTGLAAALNVAQAPQVDPKSGSGIELRAIAAVVVGGVAISGGKGGLWGVASGFLLLACMGPALTYLRVEAYWERAIQGLVILLAVVADRFQLAAPRERESTIERG